MHDDAIESVSLQFIGSMNLLNHDEFAIHANFDEETLKLPSVWQPDWPDLSVVAVSSLMSSLLHQTCVISGGHVCINVLEHDMVSAF